MPNLRIISDNAADRAALTASSTVGALVATNLLTDKKSDVWRATGTTARLTLAWAVAEAIACVALPFCNLSPTATMRVRTTNEAQATNQIVYSQQFDAGSAWVTTAATVSANAAALTAPDGTATADKLLDTTANTAHYVGQTLPAQTGAGTVTFSVFAKAGEYDMLDVNLAVGQNRDTVFDLLNGTISSKAASVTAAIVSAGNGWYRCSVTASVGTAAGPVFLVLNKRNVGIGFAGTGTSGLYVWGAQLETGSVATSYYPTTNAAAARPLGYIDSWQSYDYDSGNVLACPAPAIKLRGWTAAQSASAYAYGGGACARLWLPSERQAVGLAVDIADPNNLQGYIEAARVVAGPYWSPTRNASSASSTNIDRTMHYRTDAGDLMSRASTIHKQVPIELEHMPATDRAVLAGILRGSRAYPIFLSIFPGHADLVLERDHTVYGKRMSDSEVAVQAAIRYGAKLDVESI